MKKVLKFLKEWWLVFAVAIILTLSRLFIWSPVLVDGHSMDPTLEDKQRMIMIKTMHVERFDIVVAEEPGKNIIKRVVGLPGETISFDEDQCYVNGKKISEPYLDSYKKKWEKDKLQETYEYDATFQEVALNLEAFTTGPDGSSKFKIKVPKDHLVLLGDDRPVSKDSRDPSVGPIPKKSIRGKVEFTFWPFNSKFGFVKHLKE